MTWSREGAPKVGGCYRKQAGKHEEKYAGQLCERKHEAGGTGTGREPGAIVVEHLAEKIR